MALDLNWSAAWQYLRSRLSGYRLLGEQPSRFAWRERTVAQKARHPTAIAAILAFLFLAYVFSGRRSSSQDLYVDYRLGPHWHGWSNVQQMIVFGDSWSTTSFRVDGPAPSIDSPIGIPSWPGETVGNGPNWVIDLTYTLNESLILTADFAVGGAPLVDPVSKDWRSMRAQVNEQFPAFNANHTSFWTADTSLFFIWIGLNDIHAAEDSTEHYPEIFRTYVQLLERLYQNGARNFMFLTVAPLERSPLATKITDMGTVWVDMVAEWNGNATNVAWDFARQHNDITIFVFDAWRLLNDIMDKPCTIPQTCGLKVVDDFCPWYSVGREGNITRNSHHPDCPYSADKYFWIDPLHPTTVLQEGVAHAVHRALKSAV